MSEFETPKPQIGTWTLTAPDGRTWQADSPLKCCGVEQRERVPAEVALQRIFKACDEAPKLPELPPIPVNKQIGYEHVRYVPGYTANFVHEYAIEYAELALVTQPQAPQGAVTGWINTNDRYPDGAIDVLTFGRDEIRIGMWSGQGRKWFTPASYPIHGVTHWMPLPAAPKTETPEGEI